MRFLFYSHDSYGLGHIRRTTVIAKRLIRSFPAPSALVVTGSPRAHYFRYPPHCDYLKLPSVTKGPGGQYVSRDIDMSISETVALRGRLIREAAESFRPDVFFADHTPRGLSGELLPALDHFIRLPDAPVRIVGMRDVIDEPEAVKRAWDAEHTVEVLRRYYNLILIYGQREVFDPVREYGLPDDLAAKIRFVGYIGRNGSTTSPEAIRERFAPRTGLLVAVTAGGGGDGSSLLSSFLEGYERLGWRPSPMYSSAKSSRGSAVRARRVAGAWTSPVSKTSAGPWRTSGRPRSPCRSGAVSRRGSDRDRIRSQDVSKVFRDVHSCGDSGAGEAGWQAETDLSEEAERRSLPRGPRKSASGRMLLARAISRPPDRLSAGALAGIVATFPSLPGRSFSGPALPARFLEGVPARAPCGG